MWWTTCRHGYHRWYLLAGHELATYLEPICFAQSLTSALIYETILSLSQPGGVAIACNPSGGPAREVWRMGIWQWVRHAHVAWGGWPSSANFPLWAVKGQRAWVLQWRSPGLDCSIQPPFLFRGDQLKHFKVTLNPTAWFDENGPDCVLFMCALPLSCRRLKTTIVSNQWCPRPTCQGVVAFHCQQHAL
jgi:hypothetical protein